LVNFGNGSAREHRAISSRSDKEGLISGIASSSLVVELHVIEVHLSILLNSSVSSQWTNPASRVTDFSKVRTLRSMRDHRLSSSNGGKSSSGSVVSCDDPVDGGLSGFTRSKEPLSKVLQIKVNTIEQVIGSKLTNLGSVVSCAAIERSLSASSTSDHDDRTLGVGMIDCVLSRASSSGAPDANKVSRVVVHPKCQVNHVVSHVDQCVCCD
jgi:hypothetical protein